MPQKSDLSFLGSPTTLGAPGKSLPSLPPPPAAPGAAGRPHLHASRAQWAGFLPPATGALARAQEEVAQGGGPARGGPSGDGL